MSISFDLPASVEEQLRRDHANLDGLAKEAALVELYRQGSITQHQLALQLIESAAQMCARNRASVAALQTETARLRDVLAFAESIVLEAIDSGDRKETLNKTLRDFIRQNTV